MSEHKRRRHSAEFQAENVSESPSLYQYRKKLMLFIVFLTFSPCIIAFVFWLFSGPQIDIEYRLANNLAGLSGPIVNLLDQPIIKTVDGRMVSRNLLPVSGRIALDDLVIAMNLALIIFQTCLTLWVVVSNRQVVIRYIQFRFGMSPAEKFRQRRLFIFGLMAIGIAGAIQLFGSDFGLRYLEVTDHSLRHYWNFLYNSAAFFSFYGMCLTYGSMLFIVTLLRNKADKRSDIDAPY